MRKVQTLLGGAVIALGAAGQLVIAASQAPTPGQAQPTFRSGITAVPIDVRVIDRDGKPVADLTAEDFSVFEDGVRQTLVYFSRESLVGGVPGPAVRARTDVPSFDGSPLTRRVFLVVLGAGALGSRPLGANTAPVPDPSKALDGLLHLVRDRLLPQDQVALLTYNRATDFSADHEQLAILLERFRESEQGGVAALASRSLAAAVRSPSDSVFDDPATDTSEQGELGFAEYVGARTGPSSDIANLYYGIKYLRFVVGEKHLIYVTAMGIREPVPGSIESALAKPGETLTAIGAAASDARVALHVVQTGGVPASPGSFLPLLPVMRPRILVPGQAQFGMPGTAGAGLGESVSAPVGGSRPPPDPPVAIPGMDAAGFEALGSLRAVASATGGHASIMADAAKAMDRIDTETRAGYLLAYRPSNPITDGGYRSVRVEVNRPGVTLRFRRGYHATPETVSLDRRTIVADSRLIAAAASTRALRDIRIVATPTFVKARTGKGGEAELRMTIASTKLRWTTDDLSRHVAHLDIAVFCGGAGSKTVGQTRRRLDVALTDARFERAAGEGLPYSVRIAVESPPRFYKIVVYDYEADVVGSAVISVK